MSIFRLDSLIHAYYCMDIKHSVQSHEREGSCVSDIDCATVKRGFVC